MCMTQEDEHITKCFGGVRNPAVFNYVLKKYYIFHIKYIDWYIIVT